MCSRFCIGVAALLTGVFGLVTAVQAESNPYTEKLIAQALELNLAATPAWHALLHYKPGLFHSWKSQADDADFFLAEDGKHEPENELRATLTAMASAVDDADAHPQCRFPARYHWLKQVLSIDPEQLPPVPCPELANWFDTLRPGSLTLVFPAAYINSPASMFGHTLLRINPADHRQDSPLVAYALNYAANADPADNTIVFSLKGLTGGYPGVFSIVPYYEKIREYSDLENRDIWEYELDFDQQEVEQLMRHAWELRYVNFDYYFLTENCSYHMLSLMEAARPSLRLTDQFNVKAIPADTVRVVLDAELTGDTVYRPSSTMVLKQHADQLTAAENEAVHAITGGDKTVAEAVAGMPDRRKAMVLEQAYDYSRFLATADPTVRDPRASTNWSLLAARSKIEMKDVWAPLVTPDIRAEQGHDTSRLAVGPGRIADTNYVSLYLRPAFHDLVDPPAGYAGGAQINFGDIRLRAFVDDETVRLEKFTLINVLSISPRDRYFDPVSWGVDVAVERQPSSRGEVNAAQLVVNGGFSKEVFATAVVSLLGEANLRAADRYRKGHSAGLGVKLGLLSQGPQWSLLASLKALKLDSGDENRHRQLQLELGYHLSLEHALRFSFERSLDYDRYSTDAKLAYHVYF